MLTPGGMMSYCLQVTGTEEIWNHFADKRASRYRNHKNQLVFFRRFKTWEEVEYYRHAVIQAGGHIS